MKTPKRESEYRWCPIGETRDYQPTLAAKERARWKRKNRIAQFKRSLRIYKGGAFLPWYTHERHAYILIQNLRRPSDEADVNAHNAYTQALKEISRLIEQAVEASAFRAGKAWQMKYGKEDMS